MKNKIILNLTHCNDACYLGVDFSDSHLRLLQIDPRGNSFDVLGWFQKKLPKGVVEQGEIIKKNDFIEIVRESLENPNGSFSGNNVMISIPEEKVFTRVIRVPLIKEENKLEETIKWETESSIPLSADDIYFDWQIIQKNKDSIDVLVMAATKKIVDNYLEVFDKLGLDVIAVEPESLSFSRSLVSKNNEGYVLLIDIGDNSSNFVVCKKGLPIFTSNCSVSGKKITELIVREFGFGFEKAESYKIKKGIDSATTANKNNKLVFEPILAELIEEINKTTDFLKENLFLEEEDKKINKIILCGGGSNLKGLDSYLTVKLKQPVIQSNPWINLNFIKKIPPISKQKSQGFAPVIGLTLRHCNHEKIN